MRIIDLFEAKPFRPPGETDLADPNTGFYGGYGAGCIVMAQSTGRFMIGLRTTRSGLHRVEQPGQWGTFGGAGHGTHRPEQLAKQELGEETGYTGPMQLVPLYIFDSGGSFRYYNFLAIVPDEFEPDLNWENDAARWVEFGQWPAPMHFGLKALLNDPKSVQIMRQAETKAKSDSDSASPSPSKSS